MKTTSGFKLDQNNIKPLYEQIYIYLNKLIVNKQLKPGDQLPSEKELESMFDVSKITIRHAIQELVYENKVIKIAGKGSYILKPKIEPLTALTSFSENMIAQGYDPSYKESKVSLTIPNIKISGYLNVNKDEKVVNLFRMMLADGIPMAIQDAYLPAYLFQKNPDFIIPELMNKISLYKILELEFGIILYRAEERVDASKANKEEATLLGIEKDDPVLIIERISYTEDKKPVEYVKLIYPANRYRYKVELFRPK